MVTYSEPKSTSKKIDQRLKAFDKLAGSVSIDRIDTEDSRTKYLPNIVNTVLSAQHEKPDSLSPWKMKP